MTKNFNKKSGRKGKSNNKWIIVGFFFLIFLLVNFNIIQINTQKVQETIDKGISKITSFLAIFTPPPQPPESPEPPVSPPTTATKNPSAGYTSVEQSRSTLASINAVRQSQGLSQLSFDDRIYRLALARTSDMVTYRYMDHTNPETGACPDNMKYQYGFSSTEYLAENAYGISRPYYSGIERDAVESWLGSRGHRYNLLYPHSAGAVACSGGYCVFLGLNNDHFGEGCYTGREGTIFWSSVERQQFEV